MATAPVLQQVAAATALLATREWADELEPGDLPETAAVLARVLAQVEGALVEVTGQLLETDADRELGWASTKDFLTHLLGGRKGSGAALVRICQQTRELPAVRESLRAGEVSLAQAGVIAARTATLPRHCDLRTRAAAALLDLATTHAHDATDLQRSFRDVVADLDDAEALLDQDARRPVFERGAHAQRHLAFIPDGLGGARIRGYGSLEQAELIKTILMPLSAPVRTEPGACGGQPRTRVVDEQGRYLYSNCPDPDCPHDGTDPRDHGARMWDALLEACTRLQGTDQLPHDHGSSTRLVVTLDYADLTTGLAATGRLPDGETLSAQAVRRLACDAEIIPAVLGSSSQILDVGRAERLVTAPLWHALVLRDQHCTFPGCTRLPAACDAHHITHWADGGTTSLDNLALLCRRHHTTVHHTPWRLQLHPESRRPVWQSPPRPADLSDRCTIAVPRHPPHAA